MGVRVYEQVYLKLKQSLLTADGISRITQTASIFK